MRLDALDVAVLLEYASEGSEGLVERVGCNRTHRSAEHVGFYQPYCFDEVILREPAMRVVVVKLQEKWKNHVRLQLAEIPER